MVNIIATNTTATATNLPYRAHRALAAGAVDVEAIDPKVRPQASSAALEETVEPPDLGRCRSALKKQKA